LRTAAEQKGSRDFTPLWSGQAAALSREMPAAMLMQITVKETLERLHRLRCNQSARHIRRITIQNSRNLQDQPPPFGHRPAAYWIDEQVVTNPDLPVRERPR
jgi:hypothetical protein